AAQQRGLRLHAAAHADEGEPVGAPVEPDRALVLHQRQVAVVDGQGDAGLAVERDRPLLGRGAGGCEQAEEKDWREDPAGHETAPLEDGIQWPFPCAMSPGDWGAAVTESRPLCGTAAIRTAGAP